MTFKTDYSGTACCFHAVTLPTRGRERQPTTAVPCSWGTDGGERLGSNAGAGSNMCPCGSRGWEALGSSARVPGNKNTTYFSNCCLFPLQSIGIINKLPIKKKLCVGEKQVWVPRELGLCQSVGVRGAGVGVPLADHSWDGALWGLQDSGGQGGSPAPRLRPLPR